MSKIKRHILITGGELFNKGAQSMVFTVVNELRSKFPTKEIILLSSMDTKRKDIDKTQYSFRIMKSFSGKTLFNLTGGLLKLISKIFNPNKDHVKVGEETYKNALMVIDISGYALGSAWGYLKSISYLLRINVANRYGANVYIMPQSLGPFDYPLYIRPLMNYLLKRYLKLPVVIFAREKEGYELLTKKYKLKNVKLSPDLVLLNKGIDIENIFKLQPVLRDIDVKKNSVGIVPNMKNFKYGSKDEVINLYHKAITRLLNMGKVVYLVRHSYEDIEACETVKNNFKDTDNVILLSEDYSCLEYDLLVKKFNYIIASRYHSIVHAYKNGIPAISLGWATKYKELLKMFNQDKYLFDVRANLNFDAFINAVEEMDKNYMVESDTIKSTLDEIQKSNPFDTIKR